MKQTKNKRKCPICADTSTQVLHRQHFAMIDRFKKLLPGAYDIVACNGCGFVYADTPAKQRAYTRFYEEYSKYRDKAVSSGSGVTKWDAKRLKRTALDLSRHLLGKGAAIIDIGCANGGLLTQLRTMGYRNVVGMDVSRACVYYVKRLGIKAMHGGLFSVNLSSLKGKYDCVILCHILEHVYNLKKAIKNVSDLLKINGILYVEVPDAQRYVDYYIAPFHYFDFEHINHFNSTALMNLLLRFNYRFITSMAKEIEISEENVYPAVYAIFKKTARPGDSRKIQYDDNLKKSVVEYIQKSRIKSAVKNIYEYVKKSRKDYADKVIMKLAKTKEKIFVWGVGAYMLQRLSNTALGQCNIVGFIDNDKMKQGGKVDNILIYSPQMLKKHRGVIVVASALYSKEILGEIAKMGLNNEIVVL